VLAMVMGILALLIIGVLALRVETSQQSLEDIRAPEVDLPVSGARRTA
jgi:hypothetical protein